MELVLLVDGGHFLVRRGVVVFEMIVIAWDGGGNRVLSILSVEQNGSLFQGAVLGLDDDCEEDEKHKTSMKEDVKTYRSRGIHLQMRSSKCTRSTSDVRGQPERWRMITHT